MLLGPTQILKNMRNNKPMQYKPNKQNSIENAKEKKKDLKKNMYN